MIQKDEMLIIKPSKIQGKINIPPSKSLSHRAIITAALADGESKVSNLIESEDILATSLAMEEMGATFKWTPKNDLGRKSVAIKKGCLSESEGPVVINCRESGSTIRFLMPFFTLIDQAMTFTGQGKLVSRPLDIYYKIFDDQNIAYKTTNGELPVTVKGHLKAGKYSIMGNISSQFISGLLFVLPCLDGDSEIEIIGPLESKGYVDLTLDIIRRAGIKIINENHQRYVIKGHQTYLPIDYKVEGDYSQVAFWLVAGLIGDGIIIEGMTKDSLQGDKAIIEIAKEMNGDITFEGDSIVVKPSKTVGRVIDVSQCPDTVPVLTVLCALSKGQSRIINAERLRIKESDRLKAISTELNKLGADIIETEDGLIINGVEGFKGGNVDAWNDHRIAMSMGIASLRASEDIVLSGFESVKKSYPHFWEDFKSLGGTIDE